MAEGKQFQAATQGKSNKNKEGERATSLFSFLTLYTGYAVTPSQLHTFLLHRLMVFNSSGHGPC